MGQATETIMGRKKKKKKNVPWSRARGHVLVSMLHCCFSEIRTSCQLRLACAWLVSADELFHGSRRLAQMTGSWRPCLPAAVR